MAQPRPASKNVLLIAAVVTVISLLAWGLVALGHKGTNPVDRAVGGSGAAIYLKPSPVVTASLVNPGKKTVLWFSATWCQICKSMSPYVQKVVEQHADQVVITERDVDREPGLARQYAVRGTPTFVLLDENGKTISTRVGYLSESQFESFIIQRS
ncbi:MAG: thioredoxin family protein [Candidatus Kerfeldbacteria bacterium]|nr:thioredoxin family protein [Candidatus Kerfeldbacteria bacterium]